MCDVSLSANLAVCRLVCLCTASLLQEAMARRGFRVLDEHAGRTVVVVSHVTPIKTLVAHVLDARNFSAEPLAILSLPQRVPVGFHACWVDGTQLPA